MVELERSAKWMCALMTTALALPSIGCATAAAGGGRRGAEPLPPQAIVPPPTPVPSTTPAPPRAGGEAVETSKPKAAEPTLIVIDPAEPEELRQPSLAEAAARERARRRTETQEPVLVITNKNLSEHAAGGVLTIAHSTPEEDAAAAAEAAMTEERQREDYWRERALEIRTRWREAADRVPELESKVAELRQRFYATDNPAVRDGEVKPLWDKALADLEQARYQAAAGAEEVAAFLEEGRRAGALPGWLREGSELEPEPVVVESEGYVEHEVQEPSIYEPPPGV